MEENATQEGPSSQQFFLDMDGQGNSTSPEAIRAANERAGIGPVVEDSLNDEEMEAILSGDFDQVGAPPEGEGQEIAEPDGSEQPTEGGSSAEIAQLTQNSTEDSIEEAAKEALREVNPGMDDDGIEWLYRNNRAVLDAAVAPLQAKLDQYEANDSQRTTEGNVQQFYASLAAQITKEGVADTEDNASLRQMITSAISWPSPSGGREGCPRIVPETSARTDGGNADRSRTIERSGNESPAGRTRRSRWSTGLDQEGRQLQARRYGLRWKRISGNREGHLESQFFEHLTARSKCHRILPTLTKR